METLLVGLDIYQYVKSLCDNFLSMGVTPDMTEREEKAYRAGADAALSLLDQTLNEMYAGGVDELIVHVPGLKDAEEFYGVKEIADRMNEL